MQDRNETTGKPAPENQPAKPLSETISNAHSSGDGSLRLSEDGLIEPTGETIADAEAHKDAPDTEEEY